MVRQIGDIEQARAAHRRAVWTEAYEHFSRLDPSTFGPEDLDAMADAAWWCAQLDESIELRQRAYAGYAAAGANRRAAFAAWFLYYDYVWKGEASVASGWLRRLKRHVEADPGCVERGYWALVESEVAREKEQWERARSLANEAFELGQRLNSSDLSAMAIQVLGRLSVAEGNVSEGLELLDEAMTSVLAGQLTPLFTGSIYCNVLHACIEVADLKRAGEWTVALDRWCAALPSGATPFHGLCRIYRVHVTTMRGDWSEAESQARRACEEMMSFGSWLVAEAFYAIGEVRRRLGDLPAAEAAFTRAHEMGREPQPGLALVRLGQGKVEAAAAALRTPLENKGEKSLERARLLAACAEVFVAAGDLDAARRACDELDSIAVDANSRLLEATASTARGVLELAEGEEASALQTLQKAWTIWNELKLPYEAALARVLIGRVSRLREDEERARLEFQVALGTFERLGAALDARATSALLAAVSTLPGGLTEREAEVLRFVVAGKTNKEIAAELVISEHTVSRHLQNIFTKLGVTSRAAATAFAFESKLV